jgi:spectinomycin phosphotransferase
MIDAIVTIRLPICNSCFKRDGDHHRLLQLLADKMATLLFQLHQIPTHAFSFFETEHFDINYALGIKDWINNTVEVIEETHARAMLSQLKGHKKQLLQGLSQLQEWKKQFAQQSIPFALTHGDPHHYKERARNNFRN